ncbi:hypothetical protein AVEN_187009-1 [Araneus ventricosus]|uniref:Uncharacterized protein n=1 Tax=Araneus ventricosus TaxID=182803 RepID=A0A4Y2M8W9_ARAVE|nr:hypothetical protein AVEN_261007-1 [Araneus ventricosus]GBN22107.1 hypothetical protein AVEN_187009-1 [Araneus ventricosus]
MCRRVTSHSFVQSELSKVTMVLYSSTECLYASGRLFGQFRGAENRHLLNTDGLALICDVTDSWIFLPWDWFASSDIGCRQVTHAISELENQSDDKKIQL